MALPPPAATLPTSTEQSDKFPSVQQLALQVPSPTLLPVTTLPPSVSATVARPVDNIRHQDSYMKRQMHCQLKFLRYMRLAFRVLGGLDCLMFAVFGMWTLLNPEVIGFWEFCHWVSKSLLGVLAGLAGLYLEAKGRFTVSRFTMFAINRVSTALFYLWMGFYLMGGEYGPDLRWAATMRLTGAIAWVVAFGDMMISCTSQGLAEEAHEGGDAASLVWSASKFETTTSCCAAKRPEPVAGNAAVDLEGGLAMSSGASSAVPTWITAGSLQDTGFAAANDGGWSGGAKNPFGAV